jgi:hypothetical protein
MTAPSDVGRFFLLGRSGLLTQKQEIPGWKRWSGGKD